MFKMDTSELSGPMTGYFISGIIMLITGIYVISTRAQLFDIAESTFAMVILGAILLFSGFLCLKNAYLLDGLTSILKSVVTISISISILTSTYIFGDIMHVVIAIAFIIIAVMAFMVFEDLIMATNILWAILMIVSMNFLNDMYYVIGAVCIIAFVIDMIAFYNDWKMISGMDADYESKLYKKKE